MSATITREQVYDFLQSIPLAVFGTVSSSKSPHLVTMFYVVDTDLNFYFITRAQTAKVVNIRNNPNVSIVVSDIESYKTVEANGVAIALSGIDKIKMAIKLFMNVFKAQGETQEGKLFSWPPPLEKIEHGEIVIYEVSPTYLRYADYSRSSPLDGRFIQEIISPKS